MKDYIYCNTCGKKFVIDEVDFMLNSAHGKLHECEECIDAKRRQM